MTDRRRAEHVALGFGCATVYQLPTARERQAVLECALANGIRHFDVAPMYGLGRAEPQLGAFLRVHAERVRVATKFGIAPSAVGRFAGRVQGPVRRAMRRSPGLQQQVKQSGQSPRAGAVGQLLYRPQDYSPAAAGTSLERSLRQLRRDRIDLFLLHEPALAFGTVTDDLLAFLEGARDAGKIAAWGLAGDLADIADGVARLSPAPDVLQHPYDVVDGAQGPPPRDGQERILFGFVSRGLAACTAAVRTDPALASRVAELAGSASADRATLVALLLKDACEAAGRGTVLISSTRREHLEALVRASVPATQAERTAIDLLKHAVSARRHPHDPRR